MANYPHLLNRNGHFYFRISVPLSLRPNIGQRELFYSLKTKDYGEARTRSWAILNIAQEAFKQAWAGKPIAHMYLKEQLNKLDFIKRSIPAPVYIPETIPPNDAHDDSDRVSKVFEMYLAECTWDRGKTLKKKKGVLAIWLEIVGDTPINRLSKEQARSFKTMLMKLPANFKQRYAGKTITTVDLDKVPYNKRLSVSSVNDKLSKMAAFVNWAIRNGYYEAVNPFNGISLKDEERPEDKRHSFSDNQLKAIFTSPIYTGCKSEKAHERYEVGSTIIRDGFFWVPLIALYSGARLQEICQLYVTDVKKVGEIWVFDFNEEGADKFLKTSSSKRKTPIHPKLIKLGLLEHLKRQKNNGLQRLFPDLQRAGDGTYSSNFSKRFNYFLNRLSIKTNKTSFHSFRHTFIDALRNTDVHREVKPQTTFAVGPEFRLI